MLETLETLLKCQTHKALTTSAIELLYFGYPGAVPLERKASYFSAD